MSVEWPGYSDGRPCTVSPYMKRSMPARWRIISPGVSRSGPAFHSRWSSVTSTAMRRVRSWTRSRYSRNGATRVISMRSPFENEHVVAHGKPVTFVQRPTPCARPEKNGIHANAFGFVEHGAQHRRTGTGVSMIGTDVEVAHVRV